MADNAWSHRRVAIRPDQIPFLRRIADGLETNNLSTVVNHILDNYKFVLIQQQQQHQTTAIVAPQPQTTSDVIEQTDNTEDIEFSNFIG